jgi:eukaryotic-like serine/threonine-protein kinase
VLGAGGVATVYEAEAQDGERARVAIKIVHSTLSPDPTTRLRLLREAQIAREADHPGVIRVFEVGSDEDGAPFLVMELLQGESLELRRREAGGRLPVRVVMTIAEQTLEILAALHQRSVLHRDLKPGNLFATGDDRIKLLDFGIADSRRLDPRLSANTERGQVMGTPAFMSPEQALGCWDQVDHRTDLWALGATLFTLVTGRIVHEARDKREQLTLAMSARARPVGSLCRELPAALENAIDGALAFDREARWQSAEEMLAVLRGAAVPRRVPPRSDLDTTLPEARDGLRAALAARGPGKRRPSRQALIVALALTLTLLIGLAAIGLWLRRPEQPSGNQASELVVITTPLPEPWQAPTVSPVHSPPLAPPASDVPSAPRSRPAHAPLRASAAPSAAPAVVEASETPPSPALPLGPDFTRPELWERR